MAWATVTRRTRKLADGTVREEGWQVRYYDSDRIERKEVFAKKDDAKARRDAVAIELRAGTFVSAAAGKETFREFGERWASVQAWRAGTSETNLLRLRKYVFPKIGDMPLGAIRRTDAQAVVKAAQQSMNGRRRNGEAQPLSATTVHAIAGAMQAVFLAAVKDRLITVSPADDLSLPKLEDDDTDDEGEVVALLPEQFRDFEAALPKRWRIAAWVGLGAGLRVGEVCGLTEDRIDFLKTRRIRVNRQMLPSHEFGPPKTKASKRWVPISDELLTRVSAHLAEFPDPDRSRRLLLTGARGGPARNGFLEAVAEAAKSAGMSDRQRFHSLRHTYASILISGGCSIKVVQKRLGHEKIQETLDTYGHMLPEDDDKSLLVVEAALTTQFCTAPSPPQPGVLQGV